MGEAVADGLTLGCCDGRDEGCLVGDFEGWLLGPDVGCNEG